jgi:biopolymer transport protein ExbD
MVIVPLAPLGLDTAIPSPPNPESPIQASETPVLIQMDLLLNGDPAYRVDGISIAHEAMDAHLRDLMASRALRQVLVQADGRLDFGLVSSVVDAGHAAGADTVGLITPAMGH